MLKNGCATKWKKVTTINFIAGMILIIIYASWPIRVLEVSLPKENDKLVTVMRVSVGDPVLVQYLHSVDLTRVEGLLFIGSESGLLAVETRLESAGTGMPDGSLENTTRRGIWRVVDEGYRLIDAFRFYIVPINKTRISVGNREVNVDGLDSGTLIQITSYKTARIIWLLKTHRFLI